MNTSPPATLSHVRGATSQPLLDDTVGAMLARIAAAWPDHEALVVPPQGVRWKRG